MFEYNWPLIAGACLAVVIGEIMVRNVTVTYGKWNKYTRDGKKNRALGSKKSKARKTRKATK